MPYIFLIVKKSIILLYYPLNLGSPRGLRKLRRVVIAISFGRDGNNSSVCQYSKTFG